MTSTAESPWPVRTVARKVAEWIGRLGEVWVEGQIAQLSRRPGTRTAFIALRDPAADVSLTVTCSVALLEGLELVDGARVVVHARPDFYLGRGTFSLRASEIRPLGVGALLARLDQLKRVLAAEGLFATERKRPLPFLPRRVGLITGRASAAEHDVLQNAALRWPAVDFQVENVAVQGSLAVPEIVAALQRLDKAREVDVVVLARGGGSFEDLLTWSDEALCRAVSACFTPVVSAIGHESDTPLVDLVADVRASTPTDAAKRVVPAVSEELAGLQQCRDRLRRAVTARLDAEAERLATIRARPVLADPTTIVTVRAEEITALRDRAHRCAAHRIDVAATELDHTRARVRALSPAATLERGYAIAQRVADDAVVRDPDEVADGDELRIRVAAGSLTARAER